jgi:dipeptidyl aminopeptidase/acylaminoacyl peptidase
MAGGSALVAIRGRLQDALIDLGGGQHVTRRRFGLLALALAFPLAIVLIGYVAASFAVYDELSSVPGVCHPIDAADTPETFSVAGLEDEVAAEYAMPAPVDVEFRSRDPNIAGLVLRAWWIPGQRADGPAVVLTHGVRSCRRDDNILMPAGMLHRAGFGVLLIDLRDHGDSDDEDLRFAGGTEEYLDVLGAWDWLVAQGVPAERIGILGMSFGSAVTLIAGGEEQRVRAVWEDSSYADMPEAMRDYLARESYPTFLEPGGEIVARIVSGDDLASRGPLLEMPNYAGRRLGIVHGTADTTLPVRYAEQLRAAAEEAAVDLREYWLVQGVEHTRAVIDERAEYERRLVAFFTEALGYP